MRSALLKHDCGSEEPVLTPRAEDLHPVLGPVVTAQRYPITSWSKVTDRRSCPSFAYSNGRPNGCLEPRSKSVGSHALVSALRRCSRQERGWHTLHVNIVRPQLSDHGLHRF